MARSGPGPGPKAFGPRKNRNCTSAKCAALVQFDLGLWQPSRQQRTLAGVAARPGGVIPLDV